MGLERLCAVIQGVKSNFDCDLLRPVIAGIEALAGQAYGASETQNVPFRVIADHSRATAFLIADGVLPSNEGRGYVLAAHHAPGHPLRAAPEPAHPVPVPGLRRGGGAHGRDLSRTRARCTTS